ncbi:glutamate-rich protein 1 isoform X2 [Oryzias latipes]|uniref:glutamate-rich protein 1 isoform X2 n=1 Tax=Oryzias latipes TaxID=8090 RepID=UPI0009DA59E1|nr:glutamate-rich protein 1 isoform X2 [Oryzias latipes]
MARRKEVFQSKVLQKLYPAPPTLEKETSAPSTEALAKTTDIKRKTSSFDTVFEERRHSEESDESTEANQRKKRRRKRKRHAANPPGSGKEGAVPCGESSAGQVPAQRGECTSKNRKRKLKKKRHKEKLKSTGQMPRAAALEFTFQQVEEEEEEEEDKRRTVDLLEFLRKTAEIYLSDPSQQREQLLHLSASVDELVDSIACGSKASSAVKQLFCLKTFAEQNKTQNLQNALKELSNDSILTAEETAAVTSLFQYWLTDILPMRAERTGPAT